METKSIKEKVYESLYNDLTNAVYVPNTILNEKQLVSRFNVSKGPIREALVQLCDERLLKSIPRCGYQVVQITPKEIRDVNEVRLLLELSAFEKSYPFLTTPVLDQLEQICQEGRQPMVKDISIHWAINRKFHLFVYQFCGNDVLYDEIDELLKFSSREAAQYYSTSWQDVYLVEGGVHIRFISALRRHSKDDAKNLLAEDINSMKNRIL